ncbi:hypothetical protein M8J75_008233 [Diaphorina citri]|nr:hypothetical protein M8J75_008233 [Diaphorina citri]
MMLKLLLLMTNYFSFKSGENLGHFIRNIMKECFVDSALQQYSWCGSNGSKQAFKELQLKDIIITAAMRNRQFPPKNSMDVEKPLRLYMAQAKHRLEMKTKHQTSA